MVSFETQIKKFGKKGEKTGWTYVEIPTEIADKINPSCKKSYRVRGFLNNLKIINVSLAPMGEGNFILALNASMRKNLKQNVGEMLHLKLELDDSELPLNENLLLCLADEVEANTYFLSLPRGHKNYFNNFVNAAKTAPTQAKRIAMIVRAMTLKQDYREMIRSNKED